MKLFVRTLLLLLASVVTAQAQNFPEDGATYRLLNTFRTGVILTEDYGQSFLFCKSPVENDYSQLWRFTKDGDGWNIQNIFTGRYIQNETDNSKYFSTAKEPAVLYVSRNNGFSIECYNIVNTAGATWGVHCAGDYNVVPWHSAVDRFEGSEWTYEKVEVSDDEIAAARSRFNAFNDVIENSDSIELLLSKYFVDESCSELKSEYLSMSDEELDAALSGCGSVIIEMAKKIKNNSWAAREEEFRVHTYEPYSNPDHWTKILLISPYSWLNNPTGICGNAGDVLYIFVGKEPKEGSTLEIDAVAENNYKGIRVELKKGLNILPIVRDDQTFFINYVADTRKDYVLADFDSIPIHIEGGYVNGYWDKSRHNDEDWVDITRNHAKHKYMFVKGDHEAFFMEREYMIADDCCPDAISDAIGWWDSLVVWEQGIMGIEEYKPSRFNNRLCAISTSDGYQAAGAYNTFHVRTHIKSLLPYKNMMKHSDNAWGPAHENGHIHQAAINMIRCGEVSNNLFSNVVLYKLGKFVTWGPPIGDVAKDFENNVPWTLRNIGIMMRMYWQLYLYYHVAGNNPQFYPTLFKLLREEPLVKASGTETNLARTDLLRFAEKCAAAAGEDLTDFFDAHGFFVPMKNLTIGDYGSYTINSTTRMINDTKKKLAKYPKKAGAVQFIEDRVRPELRADGGEGYKLDYVPGKCGETGQYTAFCKDSINITATGYVYMKTGKKLEISDGKYAVGFKVYDSDSTTLLTFANVHKIELPEKIAAKDVVVVAVSANGTEMFIPSKNGGSEEQQYEALEHAIASTAAILEFKDTYNKNVGYYYETALLDLMALNEGARAAYDNKDQGEHTYGEWAAMLDKEISKVIADGDNNRVKIQPGNSYQLYNVRFPQYSMYYNNGNIICEPGTNSPKMRRFTLISTGNENEFYISSNGKYINFLQKDSKVTATASKMADAVKLTVGESGFAEYYLHKSGDTSASLHCSASYQVVGWDYESYDQSMWRLVAVELKKENADVAALKEIIGEATAIHNQIVDTANTESLTFKEGIEITSATLAADVESMMAKVAESQDAITKRYFNLCPALIDELSALITTVKKGYTVNTGIDVIEADGKDAVIYDIRGRRIKRITSSGVYIIDGKRSYIDN